MACRSCGTPNEPGEKFCGRCGAALREDAAGARRAEASRPPPEATAGERRQLTVLFCDLVGSVALAAGLDPEEWREVAAEYLRAAAATVARFGGHVAKTLGDGLLVYFGWPRAREDDPERAVRAGLALTEAIAALATPERPRLAVRVGVHTGSVVVGEDGEIYGDAPNVAARVQALAAPGTVLVTAGTHRLISGVFQVEEVGAHELKGFPGQVTLYRAIQPSGVRGRLAAARGLTPLVGRDEERRLLVERWERARDGDGQVVLVVGEPGIGKSRLVHTLKEHLAEEPHSWVECSGSAYFANTPFWAVTDMLGQALAWEQDEPAAERVARLERSLSSAGLALAETVPLVAPLLDLPVPERYTSLLLTPDAQRRRLFATLVAWLFGLARVQPAVVVLEDLHWVDPSTLELQSLFVEQGATAPVLFVFTARPEFRVPWAPRAHHTQLTLTRLARRHVRAMVLELAVQAAIDDDVVEQVVARTDGVPLFVEELTKAVVEAGTDPSTNRTIPATLHDSLMARLDRLGPAKEVAQTAAVIGREFSYQLLHLISPLPETELESALRQLADAELVYPRGLPPDSSYLFKHALVQEAAYASLLRSRRRELHRAIASALRERFPHTTEAQPELLAHHWTEAGAAEPALAAWQQAGERALLRQAYGEAVAHLRRGLEVLHTMPETAERAERELLLQLPLGAALLVAKGYGAPETAAAYGRARELAVSSGDAERIEQVLVGLWASALTRAEVRTASALAGELLAVGQRSGTRRTLAWGHTLEGVTRNQMGDYRGAHEHLERAIVLYDPADHPAGVLDPQVLALSFASTTHLMVGHFGRARKRLDETLVHARTLGRPYERCFAEWIASLYWALLREVAPAQEQADALLAHASEQGFPLFVGMGKLVRGWALAEEGAVDQGVKEAHEGLAGILATGQQLTRGWFHLMLAEAHLRAGAPGEALRVVEQGLEGWIEDCAPDTDLLRVQGDVLAVQGDVPAAEAGYRRALQLALGNGGRLYALRAAAGLARLLRTPAARAELAAVYASFDEGFDTRDLIEAKALLEELR